MKKLSILFLLLLIFCCFWGCDSSVENEPEKGNEFAPLKIEWDESNSIVCLGTSITCGGTIYGHTKEERDSTYPALLGKELKINVVNFGVWGADATDGIDYFEQYCLDDNPCLVLLEFGGNEFLDGVAASEAKKDIDSLITLIKGRDIKVVLLSFINPEIIKSIPEDHPFHSYVDLATEYYNMFLELADEHNIPIHKNIYKHIWDNDKLISCDGIHPNNRGNARMKENIFEFLYETFDENDMLK